MPVFASVTYALVFSAKVDLADADASANVLQL